MDQASPPQVSGEPTCAAPPICGADTPAAGAPAPIVPTVGLVADVSVNHRSPSGPGAMPRGVLPGVRPLENSVIVAARAMRPMAAEPGPSYTPTARRSGQQVSCQVSVTYPLLGVSTSAPSAPVLIGAAEAPAAPGTIGAGAPVLAPAPSPRAGAPSRSAARGSPASRGWAGRCAAVTRACAGRRRWPTRGDGAAGPSRARAGAGTPFHRADRGKLLACAARATGAGGSVTTVSPAVRVRR